MGVCEGAFGPSSNSTMKKFEIDTIDSCYIEKQLEFFSKFFVYIPL